MINTGMNNEESALIDIYERAPLEITSGKGSWLFTPENQRFLDFGSGIAVTNLGHCHPRLVKALQDQAELLWHCSNRFKIPEQDALAHRLAEKTFADRVFFCNSGAEANEAGLKMLRRWQASRGRPERWRTIVFDGAFHGRTLATLAATDRDDYRIGFGPKIDGFDRVPFNDTEAVANAISDRTAGILIEPVQGDGGVRVADPEFLRDLRALADQHGIALMLDEIQSGIGRTSTFLAHENAGIKPDIVSLAKGLGGGFPIGAVLVTEAIATAMTLGSHGTTFGGNPLACVIGSVVVQQISDPTFLKMVRIRGLQLSEGLDALVKLYPQVLKERRGVGLMQGLQPIISNTAFDHACLDNGLIVMPAADNVIRLLPPLTITQDEISIGLNAIELACKSLSEV